MKYDDVYNAFNKCAKARINWETLYSDAYQYTLPQRDTFHYKTDGAENDNKEIFDSTPLDCLNKFTSNIQSSLIPPSQKWIALSPSYKIPDEERQDAQIALDKIKDILFYHLHNSDFDMEASPAIQELGFGTGCLMIQRGTVLNPFQIKAIPLPELYIEKVGNGKFSNTFRKHQVKYDNIKDFWNDATLPKDIDKDKDATLIEYIKKNGKKYDYTDIDVDKKAVIVSRKTRYNPFIIFRWSVVAGEVYGRGPVLQALPDIKSLNKTKELILKSASLAVTGVYLVDEDNAPNPKNVKLVPGAMIPCTLGPNGAPIIPLENPANFNVGDIIIKDLRQSIRDMMFADALGPVDMPVKSATEISYRQQNLAKQIGSAYGRLNNELVKAVVNNCLIILDELRLIDLKDVTIDDGVFSVDIKSPLAMAQQEEEVNNILRFVESITGMFGPQVALAILNPVVIERLSLAMGIDQSIVKNAAEIQQILEVLAQGMQQQQAAQVPQEAPVV